VLSEWLKITPNWGTEQFLRLVQHARHDGIDQAVSAFHRAETIRGRLLEWMNTSDWDAKKLFMRQHANDLLTDDAEETFRYLARENPDRDEMVEVHRILLRACRRDGIDAAFDLQAHRNTPEYGRYLSNLLLGWLLSPTWEASKNYLTEQSADLLTEWAVHVTRKVVRQVPDTPMIAERLKLLEGCLEVGINEAYQAIKENWTGNG
jgi:hypothetical protein